MLATMLATMLLELVLLVLQPLQLVLLDSLPLAILVGAEAAKAEVEVVDPDTGRTRVEHRMEGRAIGASDPEGRGA